MCNSGHKSNRIKKQFSFTHWLSFMFFCTKSRGVHWKGRDLGTLLVKFPEFDIYGFSFDKKFPENTDVSLRVKWIKSSDLGFMPSFDQHFTLSNTLACI